jgi:hypothetical protein
VPADSEALSAFESAICRYQESVASSGVLGAIQYHKGAEDGKATNTGSSQTIKPSTSDFIADIEIAARRSLDTGEHAYWTMFYKSCQVVVEPKDTGCLKEHIESFPEKYREAVASLDNRMRRKLGSRLIAVGIVPINKYLKSVDVRGGREEI